MMWNKEKSESFQGLEAETYTLCDPMLRWLSYQKLLEICSLELVDLVQLWLIL